MSTKDPTLLRGSLDSAPWLFYNTRELFLHIVLDKRPLDHGNQVTVVFGHYEPDGAVTPRAGLDKVVVKASMVLVAGIKDRIGSAT